MKPWRKKNIYLVLSGLSLFLVVLMAIGCGGSGGGGGGNGGDSGFTINANGGEGGSNGGQGGNGGVIEITKEGCSGPIEILRSGTVDASFNLSAPAPDLGINPLTITNDTIINLFAVEPIQGTPYLIADRLYLFVSDGDGTLGNDEEIVNGLNIEAGVTLTLALNRGSGTSAEILFLNDVVINGTITTVDVDPTQRGGLLLAFDCFFGAEGSLIDTSGVLEGQNGGAISLYGGSPIGETTGHVYSHSRLNSAGADNLRGNGGRGGDIIFQGWNLLANSGAMTSNGGTGSVSGGRGGFVELWTYAGPLYNSGAIDAFGGSNSGRGGGVRMRSAIGRGSGALYNSGDINTSGGDADSGDGGHGFSIYIQAYGGDLRNSGHLNASGGDTNDLTSDGGSGGESIQLAAYYSADEATTSGSLAMAGEINISGGNAAATGTGQGGDSGQVNIHVNASGFPQQIVLSGPTNQRLSLVGYTTINANGGNGNWGGNAAGRIVIQDDARRYNNINEEWVDGEGGDVINEADINASGGSVVAGAIDLPAIGGQGCEQVELATDDDDTRFTDENLTNSGNIHIPGGDSLSLDSASRSNAGEALFFAMHNLTNSGNITANGGNDLVDDGSAASGYGHGGGSCDLESGRGTITNSGAININGGDGEAQGGFGGICSWLGRTINVVEVRNSGAISARGGDADITVTNSTGGRGGEIMFFDDIFNVINSGNLDVSGGAGETDGEPGDITYP